MGPKVVRNVLRLAFVPPGWVCKGRQNVTESRQNADGQPVLKEPSKRMALSASSLALVAAHVLQRNCYLLTVPELLIR